MSKHTPGPWHIESPPVGDHGASMAIIHPLPNGKKEWLATVHKTDDDIPRFSQDDTAIANLTLMAKAPQLFEALKKVLAEAEVEGVESEGCAEAQKLIDWIEGGRR